MADDRPLPELLTRVFFWGWVALSPLVIFTGLIGFLSYDCRLEYFLDGVWFGLLNLGILWTGIFLLIALVGSVIGIILRVVDSGRERRERVARTFAVEFREAYGLGWTILIILGFIAEFRVQSYGESGGLFVTLALGFVPITLLAILLAYVRNRFSV